MKKIHEIAPRICALVLAVGLGGVIGYGIGSQGREVTFAAPYNENLASVGQPALRSITNEAQELPRYVLGTSEGYVAVFYAGAMSLKERTERPVIALSEEEQQRLVEGIPIFTEEQLVRTLEDYGS